MRTDQLLLQRILQFGLILMMGASLSGCSKTMDWKEEVLLHDGSRIIVKRSQSYGGQGEIGQSSPIKEHTITFTLPNTDKSLSFKSEFSEDVGRANFNLLALHILNGTPYLVVEPNLCLAYNKWGRPNPPYVIYKHDGNAWQRITIAELPSEFKTLNLFINNWREEDIERSVSKLGYVTAEGVQDFNRSLTQAEYKMILREALPSIGGECIKADYYNSAGWFGSGWFTGQPSLEACLKFCNHKKISSEACPCNSIFKGK